MTHRFNQHVFSHPRPIVGDGEHRRLSAQITDNFDMISIGREAVVDDVRDCSFQRIGRGPALRTSKEGARGGCGRSSGIIGVLPDFPLIEARTLFGSRSSSHSQIVRTVQPAADISVAFLWSRAVVASNFFIQKSVFDEGVVAFGQPGCLCQKQPCTKIAVLYLGSTISGRPRSLEKWTLNRYPER